MTWDSNGLWLPVGLRGSGAEQMLVLMAEALARNSPIIGIEELESNLDDNNKKALFQFLEKATSQGDLGFQQVIATAHTRYYAKNLDDHQKRFVTIDANGRSSVKPWSESRYAQLFGKNF